MGIVGVEPDGFICLIRQNRRKQDRGGEEWWQIQPFHGFTPADVGSPAKASRPAISVGFMAMALMRPIRVRSKSVTLLRGGFIMGVA
jgi:hypothetical protein